MDFKQTRLKLHLSLRHVASALNISHTGLLFIEATNGSHSRHATVLALKEYYRKRLNEEELHHEQ